MLNVILTCDTEVWCGGWDNLDETFPGAYERYVYGRSAAGRMFALPFQLEMLAAHQLQAVYFVEPLFSARFGASYLKTIVDLIQSHDQEIQLHLHTEWLDELSEKLIPDTHRKRQYMRHFDVDEQAVLLQAGARLLEQAGSPRPTAFRAGGYGLDHRTIEALARCGIPIDSSYNALMLGDSSGVSAGKPLYDVTSLGSVTEFPVSVFIDGSGKLRHAQVGACSAAEMEQALWKAAEAEQSAFTIVFHNFELLSARKDRPDMIAVGRFERLCRLLADNRDIFRTVGFRELGPMASSRTTGPHSVALGATARRWAEQAYRRIAY